MVSVTSVCSADNGRAVCRSMVSDNKTDSRAFHGCLSAQGKKHV